MFYIFFLQYKVNQKNSTRSELAKLLKQVEEAAVLKPDFDIKQETKSIAIQSECTVTVTTPEKKAAVITPSVIPETKTASITPEKKTKNEIEKKLTVVPLSELPLQSNKVKPLIDHQITNHSPTPSLSPIITEKMKRPSTEYVYYLDISVTIKLFFFFLGKLHLQ